MPVIYKHTIIASRNHSLINRVIGIYRFKDKNEEFNVLLMENIVSADNICTLYELSGTKLVSQVMTESMRERNSRVVLNDVDFMQSQSYLYLSFPISNELLRIIKDDLKMLETIGSVKYKLFVAIMENCARAGVVNRLTRHYFNGMDKKKYAISIVNIFVTSGKPSKIDGRSYANKFWKSLNSIINCESL